MRFRKLMLALSACLVIGAFAVNAAQAAEGEGWTIGTTENQTTGGTLIPSGTHQPIICRRHGGSTLLFHISGNIAGSSTLITVSGVDCVEALVDDTTFKGHSEGKLTLTGVTVNTPSHCSVSSGHITSAILTDQVIMDPTSGSTGFFDHWFSEIFGGAILTLRYEGAECPLAGFEAPLKGTLCGEFVHTNAAGTGFEQNKTGTLTKVQTLLFGEAQQKTGNSEKASCALTLGSKPAQIEGALDFELSGANAGKPFGSD